MKTIENQNEHGFGYLKSKYDVRDYRPIYSSMYIDSLPEEFQRYPIKVKNQGCKPTCTAHVMSEIVEYHHHKDTNQYIEFSTEFIYGFRNVDCDNDYIGEGMYLRDGLKIIHNYGDVIYNVLPGNNECFVAMKNVNQNPEHLKQLAYENRITSYYKITSIDELKCSLVQHGPVVAGIRWYDHSKVDNNGHLKYDIGKWIGHAVLIIGYTSKGFIVQNSWGSYWGNKGTFVLDYNNYEDIVLEAYGVTDDIKAIKHPIENKKLSLVINAVVRLIISVFSLFQK